MLNENKRQEKYDVCANSFPSSKPKYKRTTKCLRVKVSDTLKVYVWKTVCKLLWYPCRRISKS